MNSVQILLVQRSFGRVAPIADTAAELFYGRLFELDPDLRPLFKSNLREQGAKLMRMLGVAVNSLNRPDELLPVVRNLGTRHVSYGVKAADYDTVGEALIWTLRTGLGEDFTEEVEEAWLAAYSLLAGVMQAQPSGAATPVAAP